MVLKIRQLHPCIHYTINFLFIKKICLLLSYKTIPVCPIFTEKSILFHYMCDTLFPVSFALLRLLSSLKKWTRSGIAVQKLIFIGSLQKINCIMHGKNKPCGLTSIIIKLIKGLRWEYYNTNSNQRREECMHFCNSWLVKSIH